MPFFTLRVNNWLTGPPMFVAVSVNVNVPTAGGVPAMVAWPVPRSVSVSHAGRSAEDKVALGKPVVAASNSKRVPSPSRSRA